MPDKTIEYDGYQGTNSELVDTIRQNNFKENRGEHHYKRYAVLKATIKFNQNQFRAFEFNGSLHKIGLDHIDFTCVF